MNRLIAVLIAAAFAVGSTAALAQGATPSPKSDAMKSSDSMKNEKDKYKECMKKDASGKETMDQACKDKMDKGAMSKSTDSMSKSKDTMKK